MKNWDKPSTVQPNGNFHNNLYEPKEDHIAKMSKAMYKLCKLLAEESKEFNEEVFLKEFGKYINENSNRLLYTNVTNIIFDKYEVIGTLQTNLEKVITYTYENVPEDALKRSEHERIQKALMKLWDHINLAIRQYELFNQSDEHYRNIAEEKMKNVEIRLTKEMNMQLISLIALFTALSFIVFGGISSLDNIFQGVNDIPVTKLMIIGTIWCFCIMNLVFVFMFFVAKLTGLNIKSADDINANLVQKYPLIWWCNLVLISILTFSSWAYYIKAEKLSVKTYTIIQRHSTAFLFFGTLAITGLLVLGAVKIYKMSKQKYI